MKRQSGSLVGSWAQALSGLFLAVSAACTTAPPLEPDWTDPGASSAPLWLNQPTSWDKLDAIEAWLLGPGPADHPDLVPEAELQLAEGRVQFARNDRGAVAGDALTHRLVAAEGGFQRVLAGMRADSNQRRRAQLGLDEARRLRRSRPREAASPAVIERAQWGAGAADRGNLRPHQGRWTRITIHHSDEATRELGRMTAGEVGAAIRAIQRFHMRDRQYGDIGYHFLIDPKGRVYDGRSLAYQGAHAYGANNTNNIGICLLGDFVHERPSPEALTALTQLVDRLREEHGIGRDRVYGHEHFRATECPGRHLMSWVQAYSGRR